jgi:hypothetical protein
MAKRPWSVHRHEPWWTAFCTQRFNAIRRNIEWKLEPLEWWMIWSTSGKWEQRGRESHQYCMARPYDKGPYEIGNVIIITNAENREMYTPVLHTEEFKRALSERNKGNKYGKGNASRTGMPLTEEAKNKLRTVLSGRKRSDEIRAKISAGLMGHKTSEETRRKISLGNTGRFVSEETRLRMGVTRKGRKHSEETKAKMVEAQRRRRSLARPDKG